MNRIDRLFGTLIMLQSKKRVRAEDIARRFEISVRTVYRDMAALAEIGVPVLGTPNDGYRLMDGYFLPPLVFTPDEASALVLSAKMLTVEAGPQLQQDAKNALDKLRAALPELTRNRVREQTEVLQFYAPDRVLNPRATKVLDFQRAIWEHRLVQMHYYSLASNETRARTIEPLALTYSNGVWYVTGFCRLRKEQRSFRLSRVEGYNVLDTRFKPRTVAAQEKGTVTVVVRFDPDVIRQVEERQHYGFKKSNEANFLYQVNDVREMKSWVLGWGAAAEVIEPPELRDMILNEAQRLVEMLT